jgi:acyl-coenzyme A thioesterase PaaI-like protein
MESQNVDGDDDQSIQRRFFPAATCFGCGPENPEGLRISSFPAPDGRGVVCSWQPKPHHAAGSGVLNGGIIGTLLDCHSAAAVVQEAVTRDPEARDHWVTADYAVKLMRPTNPDVPLELFAEVVEWDGDRATTHAELRSEGKVRATCAAHFVRYVPREST